MPKYQDLRGLTDVTSTSWHTVRNFHQSHKEEVQTNSEAAKGGPLGLGNQESQQDLFSSQEDISKYKFFSTCDLVPFWSVEGEYGMERMADGE